MKRIWSYVYTFRLEETRVGPRDRGVTIFQYTLLRMYYLLYNSLYLNLTS